MRHLSLLRDRSADSEDGRAGLRRPPGQGRDGERTSGRSRMSETGPSRHAAAGTARGRRGRAAAGTACRRRDYRNELIWIVSSRPGPTPIAEIGAPDISSSALTYAWAFFGRSENDFALVMSSDQPGRVS